MRSILAGVVLMMAGVAMGQQPCSLCSPGTTPLYYRVTFAGTADARLNGKTFFLRQNGSNAWRSEWRDGPLPGKPLPEIDPSVPWVNPVPGRNVIFYHGGFNPANKSFAGQPGKGLVSANVAGIDGIVAAGSADAIATAAERDGNGPFVIPLSIGGTATVQP